MSPLNITQPLGIWSIMATIRWCHVMSNIPKMGQLPTPVKPIHWIAVLRSPSAMVSLHPPRFGLRSCGTSNWWSAAEAPGTSDTVNSSDRGLPRGMRFSGKKEKTLKIHIDNGWLLYAIGNKNANKNAMVAVVIIFLYFSYCRILPFWGIIFFHWSEALHRPAAVSEVVLPSKTGANESTWTNGDSNLGNREIQSTAFLQLGYLYNSPSKFGGILYPIALSRTWKRGICTDFECRCQSARYFMPKAASAASGVRKTTVFG